MPPQRSKEKIKRWGDADRAKLYSLVEAGKVDVTSDEALEAYNVKAVWKEHFSERTYKNFSTQFRSFVTAYTTGEEYDGARREEASKLSYLCAFLALLLLDASNSHFLSLVASLSQSYYPRPVRRRRRGRY